MHRDNTKGKQKMPDKNFVTFTELFALIGATQFFWGIITAMIFFKSKAGWKEDDEKIRRELSDGHQKVCDKLDTITDKIFDKIDSVKDEITDVKVKVAGKPGTKTERRPS